MALKQAESSAEVEDKLAALTTNVSAIRAVKSAVEGTIGPKGLDTMLVDRDGGVIVTNDGVTILEQMEVDHPAAQMMIAIAKNQQEKVGDGTTTATIVASSLVSEGLDKVIRGVPVAKLIDGIAYGIQSSLELIESCSHKVISLDDPYLYNIAIIAGRKYNDVADMVIKAAKLIGKDKLCDAKFKLSDIVYSQNGVENEVFGGVLIHQKRMNTEMPHTLESVKILVIDDALEIETMSSEALGTESGFQQYMKQQAELKENLQKIIDLGVKFVLVDRGVNSDAEEVLTDAGVMILRRVENEILNRVAEHVGARKLKRTGLKKSLSELEKYLGYAESVIEDEKLQQVRVLGGKGIPTAAILVGAATEQIAGEKERIAKDAASSVQAAVKGGYVAGGGAAEIMLARNLKSRKKEFAGMIDYGVECVVQALKAPLSQIIKNAGYHPLEKVEEVIGAQFDKQNGALGVDCDNGKITDMISKGIVDPALVKYYAIKSAGEIAISILRIGTIIRKKKCKGQGELLD